MGIFVELVKKCELCPQCGHCALFENVEIVADRSLLDYDFKCPGCGILIRCDRETDPLNPLIVIAT